MTKRQSERWISYSYADTPEGVASHIEKIKALGYTEIKVVHNTECGSRVYYKKNKDHGWKL